MFKRFIRPALIVGLVLTAGLFAGQSAQAQGFSIGIGGGQGFNLSSYGGGYPSYGYGYQPSYIGGYNTGYNSGYGGYNHNHHNHHNHGYNSGYSPNHGGHNHGHSHGW